MASLDSAATVIKKRFQIGEYFATLVRVTVTNAGAADEWITCDITNLSDIKAVFGATLGTTLSALNFVMNCITGTGGTEDSTKGGLSIESEAGADILLLIIGRP